MSKRPERLNTVQIVRRFYRSWWKRPFWLLGVALIGVIAGRVALTPFLMERVRGELDRRAGKGAVTFRDLDVYLFPPTFVFKDVAVRPAAGGGEALDVPRAEIHAASWRELRQALPMLRVRLDRPTLRVMAGQHQLESIARALPPARIEVATIAGGSVVNGLAPAGRPVVDHIVGEVEGLASGSEVGLVRWQFWGDGSLLGVDPVHVVVGGEPNGAWQATVAGRQADPAGAGPGEALAFDGHASGTAQRARGLVHVSWSSAESPLTLGRARVRALDERWPGANLRLIEVRRTADATAPQPGEGGAIDAVIDEGDGALAALAASDRTSLAVGLLVAMVQVGDRALVGPPPGLAALEGLEEETEFSQEDER